MGMGMIPTKINEGDVGTKSANIQSRDYIYILSGAGLGGWTPTSQATLTRTLHMEFY